MNIISLSLKIIIKIIRINKNHYAYKIYIYIVLIIILSTISAMRWSPVTDGSEKKCLTNKPWSEAIHVNQFGTMIFFFSVSKRFFGQNTAHYYRNVFMFFIFTNLKQPQTRSGILQAQSRQRREVGLG